MHKPVGLINASRGAAHAQASLRETLTVMMANLVDEACVTVPLTSNKLTEADMIADSVIAGVLQAAITALVAVVLRPSS